MPKWTDLRLDLVAQIGDWSVGSGPLYARLAQAVRSGIETGALAAGTRLPPERQLAEALGVSRTTVVLAYARLRERGLIESRQGSGSWVPRRVPPSRPGPGIERRSFLVDAVTRAASEQPAGTIGFMGACLSGPPVPLDEEWQAAHADVVELACGTGYSPQGWRPLREAIAARFEARGVPTSADEILVTNGSQQAIDLLARLLTVRNDAVAIEDPTYLGAIDVLSLAGAQLLPVPVGATGVDVSALQRLVAESDPALVYLVPSFHNPTGCLMPEAARREVARLAETRGVAVVEDESLAELTFAAEPPPPIAAFAPQAAVFTVGSMSKLFWGGLRVGWVRGPRPLVAALTRLKVAADLSGSVLVQALATRLLARRDEVLAVRRRESRSRYERLTAALGEHLPDWSWTEPQGGLTLWVKLPTPDADELAREAPRHGVAVVPGPVHSPSRGFRDHLRLPFVLDAEQLAEGIVRLARAWQACRRAAGERRLGVIV